MVMRLFLVGWPGSATAVALHGLG